MRFFLLLALLFRLSQPKLLKHNSNGSIDRMRQDSIGSGQESSEDWDTKDFTHHTRSSKSDRLPFSHHSGNLKHRQHKNRFQSIDQSNSNGLNHSSHKISIKEFTNHTRSSNSDRLPFSHHSGNLMHRQHKNPFQSIDQSDSDSTGLNHSNHKISPALFRPFRSRREVDEKVQEAEKNETENEQLITTLEADLKAENLTLDKLVTDTDNKKKAYDDAMATYKKKTAEQKRLKDAITAAATAVLAAQSTLDSAGEEVSRMKEERDRKQQDVNGKATASQDAQAALSRAQQELSSGKTRLQQLDNILPGLKDAADAAENKKSIAQSVLAQARSSVACKESESSPECVAEVAQKKKAATDAAQLYNKEMLAHKTNNDERDALYLNVTKKWPQHIGHLNTTVVERQAEHQFALQQFTQKKYDQKIATAVAAVESAAKPLEDAKQLKVNAEDELKRLSINTDAEAIAVSSAETAWETAKSAKEEKEKHTKELQGKLTAAENARSELKEKVDQAKAGATKTSESSAGVIIGIVVASLSIIAIILLLGCVCYRMKKRRSADDGGPSKRRSKSSSKSKDFKNKKSNVSNTTASSTEKISGSASESNLTANDTPTTTDQSKQPTTPSNVTETTGTPPPPRADQANQPSVPNNTAGAQGNPPPPAANQPNQPANNAAGVAARDGVPPPPTNQANQPALPANNGQGLVRVEAENMRAPSPAPSTGTEATPRKVQHRKKKTNRGSTKTSSTRSESKEQKK